MNLNDEEREAYEDHLKWMRIQDSTIRKYEQDGREAGMREGIKEGIKQRNQEIALTMLKQNLDLDLISTLTGLSRDEISKLG